MSESGAPPPKLLAYVINPAMAMPLVPAARARAWMEETDQRFANRCLPLLLANQAGWFLLNQHALRVVWGGGSDRASLRIEYLSGKPPYPAISHFGHGIVTWNVPYLFRTPPDYNLLVRGPPNWPKDGASPLEGLVETDWTAATFTMNWRITRPDHPVSFGEGEPICMLVPQRRGELEAFRPELGQLDDDPEIAGRYRAWSQSRADFNAALQFPGSTAEQQRWQKHYFQGALEGGGAAPGHQTKLALASFVERRGPAAASPADDLIVQDGFADDQTCRALVDLHRRVGTLSDRSDNGYALARARSDHPEAFRLGRALVRRMIDLIAVSYRASVGCDLVLLCALVPGFRHTLHADNALVHCPTHGSNAEELVRVGCRCTNAEVRPNHTPWRKYTALLYLSGEHRGGEIVFGDGPHAYGGVYRRRIEARPGRLVLSPSNELYFHSTTPIESGARYSLNCWFATDRAHIAPDWT